MTAEILQHPRRRDSLLKIATASDYLQGWETYKLARNKATNVIKSAKRKFYSNCFEENKDNAKGIWKTIKTLTSINNKKTEMPFKCRKSADDFNNHFASIANCLRSRLPNFSFDRSKLEHFVLSRKEPEVEFSIPVISPGFVFDSLRCLNANKATSMDKLSAQMLKVAAPEIAQSLAKLMNYSIKSSVFPRRWKTFKVAPLYKSGDREDMNNYHIVTSIFT